MNHSSPCQRPEIADAGRIRLGAGYKLSPKATVPASVRNEGRIRLGAGYKLSPKTVTPVPVRDQGRIRLGAGYKLHRTAAR